MAQNSYDDYKSSIIEVLETSNEPLSKTEIAIRVHNLGKLPVDIDSWKTTICSYVDKLNKDCIIRRNDTLNYYLPNNNVNSYSIETTNSSLEALIKDIRFKVKDYTFKFCKEATVRKEIIDRILDELGWNIVNIDLEAKCLSQSGNVDYALIKDGKYQILIEAKARCEDVNENIEQLKNYMNDKRFSGSIGIITNGYEWICKMPEKAIQTNIDSNEFCMFLKLLYYNTFNVEVLKKLDLCEKNIQTKEKHFNIIYDKGEPISNLNPTDTLNAFVQKHAAKILNICNQLPVTVITDNIKDLRTNTQNAAKKKGNYWRDDKGKKFYIVRDYNTFIKRMLIQRIINELDIDARIEIVED